MRRARCVASATTDSSFVGECIKFVVILISESLQVVLAYLELTLQLAWPAPSRGGGIIPCRLQNCSTSWRRGSDGITPSRVTAIAPVIRANCTASARLAH